MYHLLLAIQYMGIIISVTAIIYVFMQKPCNSQVLLLILFYGILINLIGYTFEMVATNKEQALMAVKVLYFGKPYIILTTFLIVISYCGIHIPRWLTGLLIVFHLCINALVFTCEHHTLYYSSIDFVSDGLFPHLVLGHGIIYNLFSVFILTYAALMLLACIWKFPRAKTKIERKRIFCMVLITLITTSGLFIFTSGITMGYDITAFCYVLCALILIYAMLKYDLLDALVIAKDIILDEFIDGVLVLDNDGELLYSNAQLRQIYPMIDEGQSQSVVKHIIELCQKEEALTFENNIYEIRQKDIIHDEVPLGRIYLVSDVTENYRHITDLQKQKERADEANKAKSDFLAKMSHEIRTPINSVLGMNEMILRESQSPEIKKYAMDVKTSANSLLSIINDILDLSKIESGKMEIHPIEYDLDSLLHDIVNMFYIKVQEKNLNFEIIVQEDLPRKLYGDDVRIRQILVNLLNNAVKYTHKGTVTLAVSGTAQKDHVLMHYEIRDTGIGLKKEDIPALFISFQRLEEDRNRNIEGTGLGMSIVQQLLHKMNSSLKVDSVYGEGSTFSFDLEQPVKSQEVIGNFQERIQQLGEEYHYQTSFTAPEAKILVVDDNDINRSVFINLLKKTQIQVTDADSGEKCLELIAGEHFDLIFMDHMMPGLNGVETLHRMKEQKENLCQGVPVIVLTANAVTGAKETYLQEGFDDFLSKPIIPEKLERMIQKYLLDMVTEASPQLEENTEKTDFSTFEELPELEDFDWQHAKSYFPNVQLLKEILKDFYASLEKDHKQLNEWLPHIAEPDILDLYRIQVHALKSTSASVGATSLSDLAKLLEAAAKEHDIDKIQVFHPILMEEMINHRARLEIFTREPDSETGASDISHLQELLEKLKNALEEWDYDIADTIMEELSKCRFDDSRQEKLALLKTQILNLQTEEALATIEDIH